MSRSKNTIPHPQRKSSGNPKSPTSRRKAKADAANRRQAKWDSMTPQQKLDALDKRLGYRVGAKKQREKLKIQAEKEKEVSERAEKKEEEQAKVKAEQKAKNKKRQGGKKK